MPITKTIQVQLFRKDSQNVTFHELKSTLKIGNNWLHICGVMLVFLVLVQRERQSAYHPPPPNSPRDITLNFPLSQLRASLLKIQILTKTSKLNITYILYNLPA